MAENPKLELGWGGESSGLEERMGTQKISVSDHMNALQGDKAGDLVIDMDSFSPSPPKDLSSNSRITLQRSLSRKGSTLRGSEEKIVLNTNSNVTDKNESHQTVGVLATPSSSSPKAVLSGVNTPETGLMTTLGPPDHSGKQNHHQITITTASLGTANESRFTFRRNSFRRSSPYWTLDPKRILLIFATLSSMGTILLIYFTLSMSKSSTDGDDFSLQQ